MTRHEADRIIAYMVSTWPKPDMTPEQAALWLRDLEFMEPQPALAAMEALRYEVDFRPSPAKFVEQYRALRRAEQLKRPALPEPSPANPQQWRRLLEQARSVLTKEYPHDHRGRTHVNCPTCGKGAA